MTRRRQHYVWQKYLEPWTVRRKNARQIWCLRRDNGAPIPVNTRNVAVERDFYRLHDLHDSDANFVRALAFNSNTHPLLRDLNEKWIAKFELFFRLQKQLRSHPNVTPAVLDELDRQMIEVQESEYSSLESKAVKPLKALCAGDVSFLERDDQAPSFAYFLAHQYFRTKAIRDGIRATHETPAHKERFDRTWPIFRYVFATNVGYAIFVNRNSARFQIINAAPGTEFITSDQPVINTYAAGAAQGTQVEELELYYPLSPSRALLVSDRAVYQGVHGKQIDSSLVQYFNRAITLTAHEQILASSEPPLLAARVLFCGNSSV